MRREEVRKILWGVLPVKVDAVWADIFVLLWSKKSESKALNVFKGYNYFAGRRL